MSYYDPSPWIDKNDSLIPDVENRVEAEKLAKKEFKSAGFHPPYHREISILVKDSKELLTLREYSNAIGKITITLLTSQNYILRQGNFNVTKIHTNPVAKQKVYPPHHIHFPTVNYHDLTKRHRYAYQLNGCGTSGKEILTRFLDESNIKAEGFSLPFVKLRDYL